MASSFLAKRKANLKRTFKLTHETYLDILSTQGDRCAICRKKQSDSDKYFAVDHDHDTGKLRGLLCTQCNVGLGCFQDSSENLVLAAKYLQKFEK